MGSNWIRSLFATAALLVFPIVLPVGQQSSPCRAGQLLQSDNAAYDDAMRLAEELRGQGFEIDCMFPSILNSLFVVAKGRFSESDIEGEVAFITNRGDFSAFFVPKPQTFADFHITRLHSDQGYLYLFSGTPETSGNKRFGTARRTFFLKRDNLLIITGDPTRKFLQSALGTKVESP
jgi:hypothetical protein